MNEIELAMAEAEAAQKALWTAQVNLYDKILKHLGMSDLTASQEDNIDEAIAAAARAPMPRGSMIISDVVELIKEGGL